MVQINVSFSPYTEAVRIAHIIEGIYNNFYLKNNWYLLPLSKNTNPNFSTVFLPILDYTKIETNKIISNSSREKFLFEFKEIIEPIQNDLVATKQFKKINAKKINKLQEEYKKVLLDTINKTSNSINYLKNKDFIINVYPTYFGTCGSFTNISSENLKNKIITIDIFIRIDQNSKTLSELFVSAITSSKVTGTWENSEAVSDFITKYIVNYKTHYPTIKKIRKTKPKLLEEAIVYLNSLNLPTGKILEINNNQIFLLGKDITNKFSNYEKNVLILLIKKRSNTVTFDDIAEAMYTTKADLKFTLWGITKTIQRIRDKLQKLGLPRTTIKNVKGEGFIINQ